MKLAVTNFNIRFNYFLPAKSLVTALNFPVVAFWFCLFYIANRVHLPNPNAGLFYWILIVSFSIAFLSSIALFWYLVVREVELRRNGDSLLRWSGVLKRTVALVGLLAVAAGALGYAYLDIRKQVPIVWRDGSAFGWIVGLLPNVLLLAWAIILIVAAVMVPDACKKIPHRTASIVRSEGS